MTFEFNYDPESEEIHITFDNQLTMRAYQEYGNIVFSGFERVEDEDIEDLLKSLCKKTFSVLT